MKRLSLLTGSFLISVLLLTACGGEKSDYINADSLTGILSEQSQGDEYAGTHLLTEEDGDIVALRSIAFNLSRKGYLGNRVKVMGQYNEADEVFAVTGLSVLEVLAEDVDPGDLAVFKDSDLGFQLNYFDNWDVSERVDGIDFLLEFKTEEDVAFSKIEVGQFPFDFEGGSAVNASESLNVFIEQYYPEVELSVDMKRKVGPDNLDAVLIEKDDDKTFYLFRNGLIYELAFTPGDHDNVDDDFLRFMELVGSFKFIGFTVDNTEESSDSSELAETPVVGSQPLPELSVNLATFESLSFKFRAQYPASWYYAGSAGSGSDVIRHYGFSDEPLEDDNELLSLDLLSSEVPSGGVESRYEEKVFTVFESAGEVEVYSVVDGRTYRLVGPPKYKSLLIVMMASIELLEEEE